MIVLCGRLRVPSTREEVAQYLRLAYGDDDVAIVEALIDLETLDDHGELPWLIVTAFEQVAFSSLCAHIRPAPVAGTA